MSLSIVQANDPVQRLRIKRLWLSVFMYGLYALPLTMAVVAGICPPEVAMIWALISITGITVFYLLFRLNYNKRFRDPSLTVAQMVLAIGVVLYTQIYAGPVRGGFLFAVMVVVVFGCFRLSTRQLLLMSLACSAAYAATLPIIRQVEGDAFNLIAELMLWVAFSIFLPFLSFLAGLISQLREKLAVQRTELKELLEKVTQMATHDELTGLHNRRWLLEMLAHEKSRADRDGELFCVCLLDLDHFKRINDEFGHSSGDTVLKGFADTVLGLLRGSDVLARYGGEEFLLYLPNTSPEEARTIIARMQKTLITTAYTGLPAELRITLSAGIAQYQPQESIDATIERADQALYRAKNSGRDKTEVS